MHELTIKITPYSNVNNIIMVLSTMNLFNMKLLDKVTLIFFWYDASSPDQTSSSSGAEGSGI
jgi:hypothetical protein